MKGVLYLGNREAVVRDFPVPEPGVGEVLVRMKLAAICGSDMHLYRQTAEQLAPRGPIIPGHEPTGIVEAVGIGVRNVKPGDRVVVYHARSCGYCKYCRMGDVKLCPERRSHGAVVDGSDADFLLTDDRCCLPLPDDLSFTQGVIVSCAGATAYWAARAIGVSGRDTVAVFGLGPVGLCATLMARAMGARVVGVDVIRERLDLAVELGADEVVDASREDVVARLRALDRGSGPSAAIECSGSVVAHQNVVDALAKNGVAAFVGGGSAAKSINPAQTVSKQLTLRSFWFYPSWAYFDLVDFIRDHALSFDRLVTHHFDLKDAPAAFKLFDGGKTGKVVFEWA